MEFWGALEGGKISLQQGSSIRFFHKGIKPTWDDSEAHGKWVLLTDQKDTLHRLWLIWSALLEARHKNLRHICGIELCIRPQRNSIGIWNLKGGNSSFIKSTRSLLVSAAGLDPLHKLNYLIIRNAVSTSSCTASSQKPQVRNFPTCFGQKQEGGSSSVWSPYGMSMEDNACKGEESGLSAECTWPGVGERLSLLERASNLAEWEARSPLISSGSIWSPHLSSSMQEQRGEATRGGKQLCGQDALSGRFSSSELPSFFQTGGPMIDEPLEPEAEEAEAEAAAAAEEGKAVLSRRGRETISTEDIKSFQARLTAFAEAIGSRGEPEETQTLGSEEQAAKRVQEDKEEAGRGRDWQLYSTWGCCKEEKDGDAVEDLVWEDDNARRGNTAGADEELVDHSSPHEDEAVGMAGSRPSQNYEGKVGGSRHSRSLSRELRVKMLMRSVITTAQLEDKGVVRGHRIRTQTKDARSRGKDEIRKDREEGNGLRVSSELRKERGGEDKNISCMQRVMWLLAGSGLTALIALVYSWLFADSISSVKML
eukprot:763003-Hanusia_phi.AAC.2